jgi:predicted nicotinamide N-methyase
MEVGCGWGLAGIYCALKHRARVTGVDIDPDVFPFFELHAEINGVDVNARYQSFGGLTQAHLKGIDVILGADICFWDNMVLPLKRLLGRALRANVKLILIADPGREPFETLGEYAAKKGYGEVKDWTARRPRKIRGRILIIQAEDIICFPCHRPLFANR